MAWASLAGELARWAWQRLVNRTDAWGGYNAVEDRDRLITRADGLQAKLGATLTRPAKAKRGEVLLAPLVLERHFRARGPLDVVGLHSTSPENTSRWLALDIDWHGPASTAPEINLAAALAWHRELRSAGFSPLLTDSNGAGGFHLLGLLDGPVPTPRVFAFVRQLAAAHARHGLPRPPETFPKQAAIPPGRYGNWLRLPGRHHTRDHWSRVWDGSRWLDGGAAVEFLLAVRPAPVSLLPEAPLPPPLPIRPRRTAPPTDCNLSARVAAYMARLPNLGEGQGRDDVAYHAACFLVRDMRLPDTIAFDWLARWDGGNSPPKGEEALRKVIVSAHAYGRSPYGAGLGAAPPRRGGRHKAVIVTSTVEGR